MAKTYTGSEHNYWQESESQVGNGTAIVCYSYSILSTNSHCIMPVCRQNGIAVTICPTDLPDNHIL